MLHLGKTLVLAFILLGAIAFLAMQRPTSVTLLRNTQVFNIEVFDDESQKTFKKSDSGRWEIDGFGDGFVDSEKIEPFLEVLRDREFQLKSGKPETEFSLKLRFSSNVGVKELFIGPKNDVLGTREVYLPEYQGTIIIPEAVLSFVDRESSWYLDRTPISFDLELVSSIRIESVQGALNVQKNPAGSWVGNNGITLGAKEVERYLSKVAKLRADSFLEDKEIVSKFAPQLSLSIAIDGEEALGVQFADVDCGDSDRCTHFRLSGGETIYESSRELVNELVPTLEQLRSRYPFEFSVESVKSVLVKVLGRQTFKLSRMKSGWSVDEATGDTPFCESLIRSISSLKALRYLEPKDFPRAGAPYIAIDLEMLNEEAIRRFEVNLLAVVKGQELYAVKELPNGPVIVVDSSSVRRISPNLEALLEGDA